MKKYNYHDTLEELADAMLKTIKEWKTGNFSDGILATRCASTAFRYIAKKRGFIHKGDNGDELNFALHNAEVEKRSCELEPICKHFKKVK